MVKTAASFVCHLSLYGTCSKNDCCTATAMGVSYRYRHTTVVIMTTAYISRLKEEQALEH